MRRWVRRHREATTAFGWGQTGLLRRILGRRLTRPAKGPSRLTGRLGPTPQGVSPHAQSDAASEEPRRSSAANYLETWPISFCSRLTETSSMFSARARRFVSSAPYLSSLPDANHQSLPLGAKVVNQRNSPAPRSGSTFEHDHGSAGEAALHDTVLQVVRDGRSGSST